MSEKIPIRVQHRRMTAEHWRNSDVILLEGELGVESDTGFGKIGDGASRFSALAYMRGPKGDEGERGPAGQSVTISNAQKTGKTTRITFSDSTVIEIQDGADGAVTFESLTPQQIEAIKGAKGDRGEAGQAGRDGSVITVSGSNPSTSAGKIGDIHINSATGELYMKFSGGWQSRGNIKGLKGDKGDPGNPGQNGVKGADGQSMKVQALTQSEYDGLTNKDPMTTYMITG